tara:strand:- start:732 stop:908 length:177 start_codon:yes stop_codon:yes gene_type:complete
MNWKNYLITLLLSLCICLSCGKKEHKNDEDSISIALPSGWDTSKDYIEAPFNIKGLQE